jgi:acetyl esterase
MRSQLTIVFSLALTGVLSAQSLPASVDTPQQPRPYIYREIDGQELDAYVFLPPNQDVQKQTSAVILFHGGAWVMGSADWTFEAARRFAALGMVAVSVDYRLSQGKTTPIEAVDDTRAAFRWVRRHAAEFHIDPKRVAGYGVSAGGQLAAVAAMIDLPGDGIDDRSSKPDLLLLWCPALRAPTDLLQGRASASDYSPMEHAGAATPPTSIVNGDKDTVTPLPDAQDFRDRVVQAGGICELHVYRGVGHLLTRNVANQLSNFDPDPQFRADGIAQFERFLRERGYISVK